MPEIIIEPHPLSPERRSLMRAVVRATYALQGLRIKLGNAMCAHFRAKLGLESSAPEESDADAKSMLDDLRERHRKLMDGVKTLLPSEKKFKGDGLITMRSELAWLIQYLESEAREVQHFRMMESELKSMPIYRHFPEPIKGCGAAMSGVIISEIDIYKATYPSSLWAYAGYDTVATPFIREKGERSHLTFAEAQRRHRAGEQVEWEGMGRSRRGYHLREVEYNDRNGEKAIRQGITFNPWLKTKLHVLAGCLLKAGIRKTEDPCRKEILTPDAAIYIHYRHRLEHRPDWQERSEGHRHAAAMRYMIKMFLLRLYNYWRRLEDLPVEPTYREAKLGLPAHRGISVEEFEPFVFDKRQPPEEAEQPPQPRGACQVPADFY